LINSALILPSAGDLLFSIIITHALSFVGGSVCFFRVLIYFFFSYLHIILNIKNFLKHCFRISIINRSFPIKLLSLSLQADVCGWKPAFIREIMYGIFLLYFFYLLPLYLPAP
jgi:hypothetical protein